MSVVVKGFSIEGPLEIIAPKFGDERGFFSETFHAGKLAAHGIDLVWVQDNHAYSEAAGVLRGLHFQRPPMAQAKLVRVIRGAIIDVVVDIRTGSPSFGKWLAVELSAAQWNQLYVPVGFAHGYLTLSKGAEVLYKVSALYSPGDEQAIRYDDPTIGIDWPDLGTDLVLSDKDREAGSLAEAVGLFPWRRA